MLHSEVIEKLRAAKYGNRSFTNNIKTKLIELDMIDRTVDEILTIVGVSVTNASPVTGTARRIANKLQDLTGLRASSDHIALRLGTDMLHLIAEVGLIDIEKYSVIDTSRVKEQWFIVAASQEFKEWADEISPVKLMISPLNGARQWVKPMQMFDDTVIPLVKKADRYDMLHHYTLEKMPDVYQVANRLGSVNYLINEDQLGLLEPSPGQTFTPRVVPMSERKEAMLRLNDLARSARFYSEIQFQQAHKWLLEEVGIEDESVIIKIAKKQAAERNQDWLDTKSEVHQKVISDWSKRLEYEKIYQLAHEWCGSNINFLFQFDTRGRIYTKQHYLTPLGSDLAKSLLVFEEAQPVSSYDLCIHIANCCGVDKPSFDDRVRWVNENSEDLLTIGEDPWGNHELLDKLGISGQKKTRWQAVAALREYVRYTSYVLENGDENGFTSRLIIGLDATASGTQVLTILGRDDRVAPFVNVAYSGDRVGDFYTYLAGFALPKLKAHRGVSDTLDAFIDHWEEHDRITAKRNSMTFSYSGTKFGFGQQHWEDRESYGKWGEALTRADCRILGNVMYEVCEENIRGGAQIMKWLRDGVNYHQGGAIISWTLPDGFTAFQVADQSKKQQIKCTIGTRNLKLTFYTFQDKPKVGEHKNGISPNYVHAQDGYLLRRIVLGMPEEAPISTVHDQFSTSSYYVEDLQRSALNAYRDIADRGEAERMAEEAFGIHRELPMVGSWKIEQLEEAEFIIC